MTRGMASQEPHDRSIRVVVACVVLIIAPFVWYATHSWFWAPENLLYPFVSSILLVLLAELIVGRQRWVWIVLVILQGTAAVGDTINYSQVYASNITLVVAQISGFVLLLSPTMRHRLRKAVRFDAWRRLFKDIHRTIWGAPG
jgi:hypothetical protein